MESLINSKGHIPVSMALEVLYCPRNFYLRYVTGETTRDARMERGRGQDNRRNTRKHVSSSAGLREHDVKVASDELGLSGKIDAVDDIDGAIVPVEFKTGGVSENEYDRAQLCAYGMILEEMNNTVVSCGYLYYMADRKRVEIPFSETLRARVRYAVETAWAILEGTLTPPPQDDPRCRGCALADVCMPDETRILSGKTDVSPSGVAPRSTFKRTVFVDKSWGSIGVQAGQLVIRQGRDIIGEIPLGQFDQLFLVGKINMSGAVLSELFKRDVFTAFFTSFGRFEGALSPEKSKHSAVRIRQVLCSSEETFRLQIAKSVVDAKLCNMRVVLRRANQRNQSAVLTDSVKQIAALRKQISQCPAIETLLGVEGAGSRAYFQGFRSLFDKKWGFQRRNRRPPRDPVNAVLSFGYSILAGQVTGLIKAVGLDPYIGFLHREHYGHPCLALDLMEPFRPIIVDSIALRMFHQNMVTETDFETPERTAGAVYLGTSGRKTFFSAFSTRMKEQATHPVFQRRLSYRRLIEMDVRFLGKHLCGEFEKFTCFTVR